MSIGETLNRLVTSQKRQLELGVRKSAELIQLVKGYHGRWSVLKEGVDTRKADTETAMVKYDPANIGTTGKETTMRTILKFIDGSSCGGVFLKP